MQHFLRELEQQKKGIPNQLSENNDSSTCSTYASSESNNLNSLRLSEQLRQRSTKLKSTVTVVRSGGCVDGKVPDKTSSQPEMVSTSSSNVDIEFIELWELYAKSYQNDNLSKVASHFGINEGVVPSVGDTLIIVPALHSSLWSRWVIKDGYNPNFHWAPVVLVTDEGYVCLENFAVPDPLEINNKWEFRHYLYKDGGYHAKLTEGGGYGNIALTLKVRMTKD